MLAIKGGTFHTVTHGILENGILLADNGRIVSLGRGLEIPEGSEVLDASGCVITPGLIEAHGHIGIKGEPALLSGDSDDGSELANPITSETRVIDAFNPRDVGITEARNAGFTACCTLPGSPNVIVGSSMVFKTAEAGTVDELILEGKEHMKFALGENIRFNWNNLPPRMPTTRMGGAAMVRETLVKAKIYSDALTSAERGENNAPKPDFKLDPLVPVVRGKMRCRFHCHRADDIVTAVRLSEEFGLSYSLEHVTEGYKILSFLQEKDPYCVIGPLNMGMVKMEVWGRRLETPGIMERAGIKICLSQDAGIATKYLLTHVGMAIARGLSFEGALRALTITPASLLGIDDRTGSLEVGKDADLAIFDGNPFCNYTLCKATVINGKIYRS